MQDDDTIGTETDEPMPEPRHTAVVTKLYADRGYGFLLTGDCREVRFTRAAVLRDEFDELRIGSEVRFSEAAGEAGPDAVAVEMVSAPYPTEEENPELLGAEDEVPEMPDTWQEK